MPEILVECERTISVKPGDVWGLVGDFWSEWHPAIASNSRVLQPDGSEERLFRDPSGDEYRERLTYFSSSDTTYEYEMVAGIEGVDRYSACVRLTADQKSRTCVTWSARIVARDRLSPIAEGTRRIFESGFDTLDAYNFAVPESTLSTVSQRPAPVILREDAHIEPKLSYLSCVKSEADTLVLFLHGIGGNADNWLPQMEALGGRYNLAAMDIRGYGESSLGHLETTIEDHCNDILKVLRHVNARKLILVGLSMGSWIAASFAMRYPKLLRGLVLAGGCTGMSEASPEIRDGFRRSRSQPILAGQTPADMVEDVLDAICGPQAPIAARRALSQSMASIASKTYLDALNCFCKPVEIFDFSKILCPVLLVTGEYDRLAPPDEIRGVSRRIHQEMDHPDVRFEVLGRAGHVCNLEAPQAFNDVLAVFLNRFPDTQISATKSKKEMRREEKKNRILAAALTEFSAKGFEGASMNAIAESARVSKPTLYQYCGDKDHLFSAVLDVGRSHILTPLIDTQGSLVDRLWAFSWTYAEFVLRPDMLSLARLILGEASRRPESAEAYHRAGPEKALEGLMQFVEERVADGSLQADNVELATQDLWSLILSGPRDYHLHFVNEAPQQNTLLSVIGHGLEVFLKIYSLNQKADLAELSAKITDMRDELAERDQQRPI